MERLTEWDEFGNADIIALSDMMPEIYAELSFSETNALTEALNRLAKYEDTGLYPEDIEALRDREQGIAELLVNISCGCAVTYTRLAELAQAEKDGRLVVLPVKIGDKIYHLFGGEIQNFVVRNVIYRAIGGDACKILVECIPFHRCYWREDFGKSIFLTSEEAEAALKKREEVGNEANGCGQISQQSRPR